MNDLFETIAVAFSIAIVFGIPFAFFAFVRYLRYKETIALAEQGLLRPSRRQRNGVTDSFRWGILTTFVGIGLTLSLLTIGVGPWLLVGLIPLFVGLAFLTIYYVGERETVVPDDNSEDSDSIPPHKR